MPTNVNDRENTRSSSTALTRPCHGPVHGRVRVTAHTPVGAKKPASLSLPRRGEMPSLLRQWWRRAAAALKDRRSLLLVRLRPRKQAPRHHREVVAAVIRATSHDDRWMDYRSAARVFAWARASPASSSSSSSLRPIIMRALARRARQTRCWAVALMVAHGLLILRHGLAGRILPFDLAGFSDRSSSPAKSAAFSAFVRAYYRFLDHRSLFSAQEEVDIDADGADCSDNQMSGHLDRITRLQFLLDLLLQIRPYADGMGVPLVLEAMDCALIEVFQVYGEICTGVTRFLVSGVTDGSAGAKRPRMGRLVASAGVKVLRRAAGQSARLASYLELCRGLGVVNARRLPAAAFDRLRHEDVRILECVIMDDVRDDDAATDDEPEGDGSSAPVDVTMDETASVASTKTVVTTEWVAFGDEKVSSGAVESHWNPFVAAPLYVRESGNLIQL